MLNYEAVCGPVLNSFGVARVSVRGIRRARVRELGFAYTVRIQARGPPPSPGEPAGP